MRDLMEVLKFVKEEDPFGATINDPFCFMTWEEALSTGMLKEEYVQQVKERKKKWEFYPYTPNNVVKKMKEYIEFAWDKANNCRGLSAWRSLQHYRNWFYMFGDEDMDVMVKKLKNYEYYGKPWLIVISELLGVDWKVLDNGYWGNSEDDLIGVSEEWRQKVVNEYKERVPFEQIRRKIEELVGEEKC